MQPGSGQNNQTFQAKKTSINSLNERKVSAFNSNNDWQYKVTHLGKNKQSATINLDIYPGKTDVSKKTKIHSRNNFD